MPTTTLRLDESMKARIAAAARREGKSPHGFMLDAIAEVVGQAELRRDFERTAEERMAHLAATGRGLDWAETRAWLLARAAGRRAARPRGQKLVR
jgi:predicted transcriptional regulator